MRFPLSSAAARESGDDIIGTLRALGVPSLDAQPLPRSGIVSGEVQARQLDGLRRLPIIVTTEENAAVSVI